MSFSENLREAISIKNLTTKELSARTSINEGTISSYLKTKGPMPPADKALKLSKALDVSVEFLVTGFEQGRYEPAATSCTKLRRYARLIADLEAMTEKERELAERIVRAIRGASA